MSIQVMITFEALLSKVDAFAALLQTVQTELPKVAGCEDVSIYRDLETPHVFTLLETWSTRAAHQAHLEGLTNSGVWTHVASHLEGEPTTRYVARLSGAS